MRPPAYCDQLVRDRAVRLVRLHVAGREAIPDKAAREKLNTRRDRAFDLLIAAVEECERSWQLHDERMDAYRRRAEAGRKAWRTRRAKGGSK